MSEPILFLLSSLTIGGSERKTLQLANELHRRGRNVHVAYLNAPTTLATTLTEEIPLECLGRTGKLSFPAARRLRSLILKNGIGQVVSVNLYPLIYMHAACTGMRQGRRPRKVLTVNSTWRLGPKERLSMLLYAPMMRRVDHIVFGCQFQLELWRDRYGLEEEDLSVIYNGVDEERFSCNAGPGLPELWTGDSGPSDISFLIGTVGQLRPVKNQRELILALARLAESLPQAGLVLIGSGDERQSLENEAQRLGLTQRVFFPGEVRDVRPLLLAMDVFVVPSISETFSNAALEAMSMGKPVILSDTGGAREMVQDGVDGLIYRQGDVEQLAGLITKLQREPELRGRIGASARETVLHRFSFTRMADDYEAALKSPGRAGS